MEAWLAALPPGSAGLLLAALVGLACGAALGALVAGLAARARAQRAEAQAAERAARIAALEARAGEERRNAEAHLAHERAQADTLRSRLVAIERERASLEAELVHSEQAAAEKLALLDDAEKKLREAFAALSADALRANSQSFLDLARTALGEVQQAASADLALRQQAIDALVKPVTDTLAQVDVQLRAVETARQGHYAEIKQHIELVAQSHRTLHGETQNLVRALRAPAVRGRWGEIQLRRVVELAGMVEHCDFDEQPSADTSDGRLRPDLVIHLPGGKRVVVDAKAPLEAYLEAATTPDDTAREAALRRHAARVRAHMAGLGAKQYWAQFQPAPEFAVLFLPGETFFAAALEQDPGLVEWGVERKVIVASPTTLIALLRAVAYGWRQERAAHNAEEISRLGRELHERIGTLVEHFGKVGRRLDDAVDAYNAALGSLETRVVVSARKLKELGAASGADVATPEPIENGRRELRGGARDGDAP
jgi:DNA recombination protein RmuC